MRHICKLLALLDTSHKNNIEYFKIRHTTDIENLLIFFKREGLIADYKISYKVLNSYIVYPRPIRKLFEQQLKSKYIKYVTVRMWKLDIFYYNLKYHRRRHDFMFSSSFDQYNYRNLGVERVLYNPFTLCKRVSSPNKIVRISCYDLEKKLKLNHKYILLTSYGYMWDSVAVSRNIGGIIIAEVIF